MSVVDKVQHAWHAFLVLFARKITKFHAIYQIFLLLFAYNVQFLEQFYSSIYNKGYKNTPKFGVFVFSPYLCSQLFLQDFSS